MDTRNAIYKMFFDLPAESTLDTAYTAFSIGCSIAEDKTSWALMEAIRGCSESDKREILAQINERRMKAN